MPRPSAAAAAGQPAPRPVTPAQEEHAAIEKMFEGGTMTNGEEWERFLPGRNNYDGSSFRSSPPPPQATPDIVQKRTSPTPVTTASQSNHPIRPSAAAASTPSMAWSHRDLRRRADINLEEAQCSYYGNRYY